MLTPDQIDLETEVCKFATDNELMGFFDVSGLFFEICCDLEKLHRKKVLLPININCSYALLIDILYDHEISERIKRKLTINSDDRNIVKKFSLIVFYYSIKCRSVASLSNFSCYEKIFEFFFEHNSNELEKLIRYAIDNKAFDFITSILQVFSKTGNIPILVSGVNQFLEAFKYNRFKLTDQSFETMQNLKTSLDKLADHETYAETLEKLNSFLAQQMQLRPEVSPTVDQDSFSLQQMQLSVDQTQVVHEQPNFL